MSITWEFHDGILVVTETGVISNADIEQAIVGGALRDARARPGLRVLWDARQTESPLSSEDLAWRTETMASLAQQGVLSRLALIWDTKHPQTIALVGSEMPKAVRPLQFRVFTDRAEGLAWLGS